MKGFISWSLACLVATSAAFELVDRDEPAVLHLPIQRRQTTLSGAARDRLRKRAGTVQATLENEETLYFINGSLGTPAQNFQLHIDTGSSDLWVNTATSKLCQNPQNDCAAAGTYNANKSSTYKYVNSLFNISYEDGSGAVGDYATDNFHVSNVTVDAFQFGIGYTSSSPQGILGIGYAANEVQASHSQPYPNFPVALVNSGATAAAAFSLWLNDLDANTGSVLFGGVDTAKYNGTMATVPIISIDGVDGEFFIALTGLGQNGNANSVGSNLNTPVLLDSGSSLTYLPDNIVSNIFNAFNVDYNSNAGEGTVDCSLANQQGSIDFTFSGQTISVALSELVLPEPEGRETICIFGIAPAEDSPSVLGDTFLRSAYVVYDLQSNVIGLAQTDFNTTNSNVMEIQSASGAAGIPSATPVASPVTNVAGLQTGPGRIGGSTIGGSGSSGSSSSSGGAAPGVTPPPQMAYGMAAAAGLGAALLAI